MKLNILISLHQPDGFCFFEWKSGFETFGPGLQTPTRADPVFFISAVCVGLSPQIPRQLQ